MNDQEPSDIAVATIAAIAEKKFRRVVVLLGGPSSEREVSWSTGRECAGGLRDAGYEVIELDAGDAAADPFTLISALRDAAPDVVFNALHGRYGEDGVVQGVLEWLQIPYTHSGVAASAVAMDKARAKQAFAAHGLPIVRHVLATAEEVSARHLMPPPYVVKPNAEGSSVGVHIVAEGANQPPQIARDAAGGEGVLMVERFVPGRELTVSVMGERALGVTEIFADGWYDYHAKYAEGGSRHVVPAEIPPAVTEAALKIAIDAHKILGCRGVTRSDFRFDDTQAGENQPAGPEKLTLIETNTQPGMTPTSLVPEQAIYCGLTFSQLVAWMVEDASIGR